MPVIKGNALVGQVVVVSPNTSRVLLIIDHSSGVDSLIQSSRVRGVVEGLGRDVCELRYVPREEEVAIGDRIITSGVDGVYPKGLMVGLVSDVDKGAGSLFWSVKVKPAVNFSRLETVLIITSAGQVMAEESSSQVQDDAKGG